MKYSWGSVGFSADANKVGKELSEIEKKESLTRDAVVEYAKNPKTELHKCFEWDDTIAAEKYRLTQASHILTSIVIVNSKRKEPTKVFANIKINDESNKREYVNIASVLENDNYYNQLLYRARNKLENLKKEYDFLVRLEDLKDIAIEVFSE